MKNDWQTKKLGKVLNIQNGYAFDSKKFSDVDGLPLIRIRDLKTGVRTETNYNGDYDEKYIVHKGNFLIGMDGEFECYEWKGDKALLNQRVCRLQNFDGLDSKFLFYGINKYLKSIEEFTTFTTVKHISSKQIENIEFSYPQLISEQKRIVKILDEVFEKIEKAKENTEKNLQNSRELFESYLQYIFENGMNKWEETTLGEAYDVRDGTHDSPRYHNQGYALITSKNLKRNGLQLNNVKYISEKDYIKINKRSKVDKGDILLAMIGTIGSPILVEAIPEFAIKNVALFKTSLNQNGHFLKYYLDSNFVINKMTKEAKGTTQKFVGLGYLRNFPIKLPSDVEQREIVKKLDELSEQTKKLEEVYKKKLADLEELKKAILAKAFAGELLNNETLTAKVKPFEVQQAIGSILQNDFERGEMVLAKTLYLSQEIYNVPLNIPFTSQNFGPYDPHIKKAITAGLMQKNKFFKKKSTSHGEVFALDVGSQKLLKYAYSPIRVAMNKTLNNLLPILKKADSTSIERLATVCKIIQDNKTLNIQIVQQKMKEWKGNKFSDEQVLKSLTFIKQNNWDKILLK